MQFAGSSSHHSGKFKNPYTFAKDVSEEIVVLCEQIYGLKATITRFYNVYGPGELVDSHMAAVVGLWRAAVKNSTPILIHGDGKQKRDFTHIDDIVNGLILIAESDEKHEDAWELGTGRNYSLNELASLFAPHPIQYIDDVMGNYRETLRINDDALNILGWQPKDQLKEYINEIKLRNNGL
jgi:UDP-glucose 4-epimerase